MGLAAMALVSAAHVGEFSPLPVTVLLDGWIIAFLLTTLWRSALHAPMIVGLVGLYATVTILTAWIAQAPAADFLQAYRWMLYLLVFAMAVGMQWTHKRLLVWLSWWLVSLATAKAVLTLLLFGPDQRPGLFLENNFELALFSGLTAIIYRDAGRHRFLLVALLGALTILAGSRSGAVAYLFLVIYAIIIADLRDPFLRFISVTVPAAVVVLSFAIFQARSAESEVIDRVRFFDLFLRETQDWTLGTWVTGTPPMTPLSTATCTDLAFYEQLFSAGGACYSVILHAFAMRIIFDAGLLGMLLVLLLPVLLLRRAGTSWTLTLTLSAIAVSNGLSVSGLNNPYVALPVLLAILLGGSTGSQPALAMQRIHVPRHMADRGRTP